VYQSQIIDDECGPVDGKIIDKGNQITWRKPAHFLLVHHKSHHGLTWARTRAVEVKSPRTTAWAIA
jgi:hypothetical protein